MDFGVTRTILGNLARVVAAMEEPFEEVETVESLLLDRIENADIPDAAANLIVAVGADGGVEGRMAQPQTSSTDLYQPRVTWGDSSAAEVKKCRSRRVRLAYGDACPGSTRGSQARRRGLLRALGVAS